MKIAQDFFSVQCEGDTTGVPSYFVRLSGCNLSCGMSAKSISALHKHLNNNPDISGSSELDREYGDLLKEGKATWVCDTISVWLNGKETDFEALEKRFADACVLDRILKGDVHIIWTGGEPTMPHHQKSIMQFLDWLNNKYPQAWVYSEIETNGSLVVDEKFYKHRYIDPKVFKPYIQQINCSAKLANSGMEKNRRINPEAIKQIMSHWNYWFKFVVSKEDDIKEIQEDFQKPFKIADQRIIIMPGVDALADLSERTNFLFEMSKKYGYRGITRSQVLAWDRVTGV